MNAAAHALIQRSELRHQFAQSVKHNGALSVRKHVKAINPIVKMSLLGEKIAAQLPAILTRNEVGRRLGISGERVRQVEQIALGKIATRMKEQLELEDENGILLALNAAKKGH